MNVTLNDDGRLSYECGCGEPAARLLFNGSRWTAWCAECVIGRTERVELPVHRVQTLDGLLASVAAYWQRRAER